MRGEPIHPQPRPLPRERKARKPLKRTRMKRRPPKRLKRAGSDPLYLAWVRTQECKARYMSWPDGWCEGRIHAHHTGRRPGVSMKAPDDTAIPLCEKHHRAYHDGNGIFTGLSKLERWAWSQRAIADTQGRWAGGRT